ncbi:hypothetical protein QFZ66_005849 [Streptomyces sp. B4I13]|nr:hypothetical protein [Streptomyces sp. B4I13]
MTQVTDARSGYGPDVANDEMKTGTARAARVLGAVGQ